MRKLLLSVLAALAFGVQAAETGFFTDARDGQTYKTAKIGDQTWMAQNLNYRVDSSWCSEGADSNCVKYGRLYRWSSAMALDTSFDGRAWAGKNPHQGVCPAGWHLPSDAEWTTLMQTVDTVKAGSSLESVAGWSDSNATDDYGFSVLPGGYRDADGLFFERGSYAYFWSATEDEDPYTAWYWNFYRGEGESGSSRINNSKAYAISVRCLKD